MQWFNSGSISRNACYLVGSVAPISDAVSKLHQLKTMVDKKANESLVCIYMRFTSVFRTRSYTYKYISLDMNPVVEDLDFVFASQNSWGVRATTRTIPYSSHVFTMCKHGVYLWAEDVGLARHCEYWKALGICILW